MKNSDYDKLFDELLGLPYFPAEELEALKAMTREDLDRLVPIIDDMTKQAENRGRFAAYLEIAAERLERDGQRKREAINTAN